MYCDLMDKFIGRGSSIVCRPLQIVSPCNPSQKLPIAPSGASSSPPTVTCNTVTTMSNRVRCPKCEQPPTQVGQFWICPQHGQVPPERPFIPLKIFLSYGHDANEELVRQIKADLEKRGHDVWFDKSGIKELGIMHGDDWRRAITDGIVGRHVLSFLSKHSIRDPGVCLDEISIAVGVNRGNIQTILVESEQEVKPPATVSHIQWLDMHDWRDRRGAGDVVWEEWYRGKFAEIVQVVESDKSQRFAGEIEKLAGYPQADLIGRSHFCAVAKGVLRAALAA